MPFSDYSHNSKFIAPFDSNCNIAIDLITSKYVHILALVKKIWVHGYTWMKS